MSTAPAAAPSQTSTMVSHRRCSQRKIGSNATSTRYTAMNHSGLTTSSTPRPAHSALNTLPRITPSVTHTARRISAGTASRVIRFHTKLPSRSPRLRARSHATRWE